jgi:hypothetical protein
MGKSGIAGVQAGEGGISRLWRTVENQSPLAFGPIAVIRTKREQ